MAKLDHDEIHKMKTGQLTPAQVFPLNASHVASAFLVGHLFYSQGKIPAARRIFEGMVVLDPRNPYVHAMLGAIYQKQQRYRLSLQHYNTAILIFPGDTESIVNRGEIFLRFGKFQEAASDFKTAIDLDPNRKSASANRARLLSVLAQESLKVAKEEGLVAAARKNR